MVQNQTQKGSDLTTKIELYDKVAGMAEYGLSGIFSGHADGDLDELRMKFLRDIQEFRTGLRKIQKEVQI